MNDPGYRISRTPETYHALRLHLEDSALPRQARAHGVCRLRHRRRIPGLYGRGQMTHVNPSDFEMRPAYPSFPSESVQPQYPRRDPVRGD